MIMYIIKGLELRIMPGSQTRRGPNLALGVSRHLAPRHCRVPSPIRILQQMKADKELLVKNRSGDEFGLNVPV